jgi:2',3'-cyclic-nucleotide 2'-phosphodiesterase (5'-nucleotidase family)
MGTRRAARSLALLFLLLLPAGAWADGRLLLYYSASLNGNLDGCTCERNPTAGLVKRAAFLRARRSEDALRVDGGDLLSAYPDRDLADPILATYGELGYAAVAVGEQELSLGVEALCAYRDRYPLLGHNLSLRLEKGGWTPFSPRPLLVSSGGLRVGIFALLEPDLLRQVPPEIRRRVRLAPAEKAAQAMIRRCEEEGAELILLLYHGTQDGLDRLLARRPPIHLALLAHEQRLVDAGRIGRTVVVSPGEQGNRLGILRLEAAGSPGRTAGPQSGETWYTALSNRYRLFSFRADPDDPAVRERADRYREALRSRLQSKLPTP